MNPIVYKHPLYLSKVRLQDQLHDRCERFRPSLSSSPEAAIYNRLVSRMYFVQIALLRELRMW
jgi:hypothetical protein